MAALAVGDATTQALTMREAGRIVRWLDESGYGFAAIVGRPESVFVHCRALRRGSHLPPVIGEGLVCDVEMTSKGPRAADVVFDRDEHPV